MGQPSNITTLKILVIKSPVSGEEKLKEELYGEFSLADFNLLKSRFKISTFVN
ncbi:MAG: hypothetical protein K0S75_408 [Clostridia bacterium]|jgi:hypothetical protein|nr:hypothetical protein [Clostridia bacterium]